MPQPQKLLLAVAREPVLPIERRRQAVQSLVDHGDAAMIGELVADLAPGADASFHRVIAQALARRAQPPPEPFAQPLLDLLLVADEALVSDLAAALGRYQSTQVTRRLMAVARDPQAPVPQRCAAIRPLAFHRSQQTVAVLVQLASPDQPQAVARGAAEALALLTGIDGVGAAAGQWQLWWARYSDLPPARWYAFLADNLARRAALLERDNQRRGDRLLEVYRLLYRATSQEERQALLAALLADAAVSLRQLAIDLMRQRLNDQQVFGPALRAALLPALDDADASIRQGAARLLRDLGDEVGADAMERRLIAAQEQDPAVLSVYLLVMADQPRAEAIGPASALLANPDLRNEAAGVLVRAVELGFLGAAQQANLRLGLRRQIAADKPPEPKVIELLGYVGDQDDWRRIEQWIDSDEDKVKQAAALAWARSDRSLCSLAQRAADPQIEPIVIAAAERRGREPRTLMALCAHPPEPEQTRQAWQRALVAMAGRVTAAELLAADAALAGSQQPPGLRRQMLSAAIAAALPGNSGPVPRNGVDPNGPDANSTSTQPTDTAAVVELLLRRAELRLASDEPKAAVADLALIAGRKWRLEDDQTGRHADLSMRAKLADADATGAFQIAGTVLNRARLQGNDAFDRAAVALAPVFLDAAKRHIAANQAENARAILAPLGAMVGSSLPAALKARMRQLEDQAGTSPPGRAKPDQVRPTSPTGTPDRPETPTGDDLPAAPPGG